MRHNILKSLALLALLIAPFSQALSQDQPVKSSDAPKIIRFGVVGNAYTKPYGSGIIGILHQQGLLEKEFEKDGTQIQWNFFVATGPAINESIANDALDFASYGDLPTVIGKAGGLKTIVLASSGRGQNIYIGVPSTDTTTHSIADLKGKRVAFQKGTYIHLVFDRVLAAHGFTESDFQIYNLLNSDSNAAIAANRIDAIVSTDLRTLVAQGLAREIYNSKSEPDLFKGSGAFVVTEDFAKKYPDVVQRIVNQYVKAAFWASEEKNRDAYFYAVAKTGSPYSTTKYDFVGDSLRWRNNPLVDDFWFKYFQSTIDFSLSQKLIRNTFDLKSWPDLSYLNKALQDQGLADYWAGTSGPSRKVAQN
jgi:sulfonate transport system substrate-binding protein